MVSTMKLPEGWIVQTSTSHPNRVYYFNTRTNKASWDMPIETMQNPGPSKTAAKGKKRKTRDDASEYRPVTPDLDVPTKNKVEERRTLKAKRNVAKAQEKNEPAQNAGHSQPETIQMKQLREKILARQAKGNAFKRSKTIPMNPPDKKVEVVPETSTASTSLPLKAQNLTPQMRVMLEKMKDRQFKGIKSPGRKSIAKEETKVTPLRRPRTRSLTPAETPVNVNGPTTRKSFRVAANTETSSSVMVKKELTTDKEFTAGPTVLLRREIDIEMGKRTSSPLNGETSHDRDVYLPEKAKTPRLGRSAIRKKNLAEERLAKLQRSFGEDKSEIDGATLNDDDNSEFGEILRPDDSMTVRQVTRSPPCIYKNAEVRAKFLRERIHNKSLYQQRRDTALREELIRDGEENVNVLVPADDFYEEMDWEPIEDEQIMQEVQAVRSHICAYGDNGKPENMPENSLDLPDGLPAQKRKPSIYIVIDTNVFLSNIAAIEEARDAEFKTYGQPLIVVPWTVIRELDFIKDDKSMSRPECLRAKARAAVRFLNQHFTAKHPRVLAQTPYDVATNKEKFNLECPDDEILQTCLQIHTTGNRVVLLSYDKNLCNKAMIHDLVTLGRHDPLEKVDYLHASDARNDSFLTRHLRGEQQDDNVVPVYVKELRKAEELMEEAKEVLTSFMSVIVIKEMQNLYNDNWEKYTVIRPPWTVCGVLQCAIKHWIAAVSDSFTRRANSLIRELLEAMNRVPDSGRKLSDVSHILETINDLLQCVKVQKYPNVMDQAARAIADLRARCVDATKKLYEEKIHDAYGAKDDEEARALNAFNQFEEVYAFARDMCGLASDAIGMPCSFPYKRHHPEPTIESVKEMQPDVAANLNRLLQVLATALEEINNLRVDHRAIEALYHALSTFMPDQKGQLDRNFSPLDVYCCLKKRDKCLKLGLAQLQELSSHFCRMASFRCT